MNSSHKILLSFDVEEFDLPLEYKQNIIVEKQLQTGFDGLINIMPFLEKPTVKSTLFTTAFFAEHYTGHIKQLAQKHEIASHTYYHSTFKNEDLINSRLKLENITGKPVTGLRMPRMMKVDTSAVSLAGYTYNSSINPCWIPGRYNNLNISRTFFNEDKLIQLPVSVTAGFRVPLFWLSFRNFSYNTYLNMVIRTLKHDGYVCLYFHPWEFTNTGDYKLPWYIQRTDYKKLLPKLDRLITDLSGEGEFMTIRDFLPSSKPPSPVTH